MLKQIIAKWGLRQTKIIAVSLLVLSLIGFAFALYMAIRVYIDMNTMIALTL